MTHRMIPNGLCLLKCQPIEIFGFSEVIQVILQQPINCFRRIHKLNSGVFKLLIHFQAKQVQVH